MALLFGMFSSWVLVLRKLAARKHNRLKKKYESADKIFRKVERDCKNDEVAVGRPGSYSSQLRLIKLYDSVDNAKTKWIASKQKLNKRKNFEKRLKTLRGRKVPYAIGLLDMAIVAKGVGMARENGVSLSYLTDTFQSFIN
ncbi:MAG: hypothetical protein AB8B55_01450 [Mariniblastus sp.]